MAEWQTRRTQNPLSERACGFKSHPGHQIRRRDHCSGAGVRFGGGRAHRCGGVRSAQLVDRTASMPPRGAGTSRRDPRRRSGPAPAARCPSARARSHAWADPIARWSTSGGVYPTVNHTLGRPDRWGVDLALLQLRFGLPYSGTSATVGDSAESPLARASGWHFYDGAVAAVRPASPTKRRQPEVEPPGPF